MSKPIITKSVLLATLFLSVSCQNNPLPTSPVASLSRLASASQSDLHSPPVRIIIKRAEIGVSRQELNKQFQSILKLSNEKRLLNAHITPQPNGRLLTTGKIKAKSYLPKVSFELLGKLSVRPNNTIRFTAEKVKVAGIPMKGLMDIIGLELSNIAKFKDRFGRIEQKGNSIDLIIERFTKDAVIEGQIKQIQTSANELMVIF